MPYYTAVVTGREDSWELAATDLDDVTEAEDAADLADTVRAATGGEGGLAVIEHEDDWFCLVRVDGEEDPRVFVSDLDAILEGPYAGLVGDLGDAAAPGPAVVAGVDADDAADPDDEDDSVVPGAVPARGDAVVPPAWAGDAALLEDHGVAAGQLTEITERAADPAAAVLEIAKRLGFDDLVDAWH